MIAYISCMRILFGDKRAFDNNDDDQKSIIRVSMDRVCMKFMPSLISAGNRPGRRRGSPRCQPGGKWRYHSIARAGHRRRSVTRSSVRGAIPGGVCAPTSPLLCMAERELLRCGLSVRFELDVVARPGSRRIEMRI